MKGGMTMFEADSKTIWEDDVRELAVTVRDTCKSDPNLTKTLESMIKYVDSDIAYGINFYNRVEPLYSVLKSQSYYSNVHKNTPEAELVKIRELVPLMTLLYNRTRHELNTSKIVEEKKVTTERLPNGKPTVDSIYAPVNMKDRNK